MKKLRKKIEGKWFYSLDGGKSFDEDPDQTEAGTESPAHEASEEGGEAAGSEEEKPTEEGTEAPTEAEMEQASKMIAKHLAEYSDMREAHQQKMAAVNAGAGRSSAGREVKLFTTSRGKDITMKADQAELAGKWFQAFLKHHVEHNPEAFYDMKKYAQKLNPLDSATAGDGGNLVPVILHDVLIPLVEDMSVIRPNAQFVDMTNTKTLDIPTIAGKPVVSIAGEGLQKASSSMQFGKVTLSVETLAAIVPITKQLIDFSPFEVVRIVTQALAESIAKAEDRLFMVGTGSSQPKGIDAYTFAKTINAGGNINFTHLNEAYFGLGQYFRNRAFWIMGSEEMAYLANMKDSQNRPIFDVAGVFQQSGLPTIKGRPVLENNNVGGKIFFGDLKSYWVGASRNIDISIADQASVRGQSLWERNMVAVRAEEYLDGRLGDERAFTEIQNV